MTERTIARVPWLAALSAAGRRELAARGVTRRFAADEVLWRRGDEPRGLFIVLVGAVRVVRGSGGRQHVLHREGPGGTLGEVPLFGGGTYPATVIAEEPTECLVLSRASLEAAIEEDPRLARLLLGRLSARVRELAGRLDRVTTQPVARRLAGYLLLRHDGSGGTFSLGQSQAKVAEDLGTVREVVVRELRVLVEAKVVRRVGAGRYRVIDATDLRRRAGG
ncbi:MAG TPA: cyclic nucleotide-binding domain-containing protein [Gemmatimonadales bacterium]|nr:cyclic nucleotide-binding domain-containing protein [Gemmatimonadales bacterium]